MGCEVRPQLETQPPTSKNSQRRAGWPGGVAEAPMLSPQLLQKWSLTQIGARLSSSCLFDSNIYLMLLPLPTPPKKEFYLLEYYGHRDAISSLRHMGTRNKSFLSLPSRPGGTDCPMSQLGAGHQASSLSLALGFLICKMFGLEW